MQASNAMQYAESAHVIFELVNACNDRKAPEKALA